MFSLSDMPVSPLALLTEAYQTRSPSLLLISGPSGSGKTRWCQDAARYAREQGWPTSGLLSPAVLDGPRKIAIDLLDLSSDQRRRLATRVAEPVPEAQRAEKPGIVTGSWRFDPEVISWGNQVLARNTARNLVFIDELGPLEFREQQGLRAALRLLDSWRYRLACVTLRPSLVGAARMRWPWGRVVVLGEEGRD